MARKKTTKTVQTDTTDLAQPQSRTEEFLAKIAGVVDTLPEGEFSRLERYLKYIAENGAGGGGVTSFNTRTGAVVPQSADYASFYAPAGYGLGENASRMSANDDLNDYQTTGWYNSSGTAVLITIAHRPDDAKFLVTESLGLMMLRVEAVTANWVVQTAYNLEPSRAGCYVSARRYCENGTWSEWEYINPPLIAGTEYRTTERFLGKPVYQKVFYVTEGLPDANTHQVTVLLPANVTGVIDARAVVMPSGANVIGGLGDTSGGSPTMYWLSSSTSGIVLSTTIDMVSVGTTGVYFIAKYVK